MERLFKLSLNLCLILWIMSAVNSVKRVRRGLCSSRNLAIANGDYTLRSGNSIAKYTCFTGFQIYGSETLVCFGTSWNTDPPLCIASTCPKISPTPVMRIKEEYNGSLLKISCAALHRLQGSSKLLCTGQAWTDKAPTCTPWDPPLSCDLESSDLCGWYHDELGDQEWRWNTGSTPTSRTGPSHDHTFGPDGNGHYVYFETSSPTRTDHKAMLNSPLYPAEYSRGKCFTFWYHILGSGDIGDLELFFKPDEADLKTLTPVFTINEDGGDVWYAASVHVTPQDTAFQIVFVATRATSYRSDFAIDDFSLGDCTDTISTVNTSQIPEKTTVQKTMTTTLQPTTLTTVQAPVTTAQITTVQTTKAPTTVKPTEVITTTPPQTTKVPVTTPPTSPKTTVPTTPAPVTSKQTTVLSTTTQKPSAISTKSSTKQMADNTVPTTSSLTQKRPVTGQKTEIRIPESRDNTSHVVYIVIGLGLMAAIVGGAVAGVVCYRRRLERRKLQRISLSSTNPLYKFIEGDESAVHFAVDPQSEDNDP